MSLLDLYFKHKNFTNEATINEYEIIISRLLDYFNYELDTIGQSELLNYLDGPFRYYEVLKKDGQDNEIVITKEYASTTYEKNVNIIKSFFNTLYSNKLISTNYAEIIEATENNRTIKFDALPSAEEILAIQKYLYSNDIKNDYFALRDLVIFNLIFHSGFSTEELTSLSIGDTGFDGNYYFAVIHKPKERKIKLSLNDVKYLSLLLVLREKIVAKDDAIFISNKHKKRIARRSFSYLINELCKTVEIKTYSAEKFKQAGIVAALSVGYDQHKMIEEMQVSQKYFNQRFKHIDYVSTVNSYADLFKS